MHYEHPIYTPETVRAQSRLSSLATDAPCLPASITGGASTRTAAAPALRRHSTSGWPGEHGSAPHAAARAAAATPTASPCRRPGHAPVSRTFLTLRPQLSTFGYGSRTLVPRPGRTENGRMPFHGSPRVAGSPNGREVYRRAEKRWAGETNTFRTSGQVDLYS